MEFNGNQFLVCIEKIEIYAQDKDSYRCPAFKITLREGCFEKRLIKNILVRIFLTLIHLGGENSRAAYLGHKTVARERAIIFYRNGEWPERYYSFFVEIMERVAAHNMWEFSCARKVRNDLASLGLIKEAPPQDERAV
jgi:hypothetical protein